MMRNHIPDPAELPSISQEALDDALRKHVMFLRGQPGGVRAIFQYSNLSHLDFKGGDLTQADFAGSALVNANLASGNFMAANFFACDLRNADLRDANLSRADLRGAYIAGANLAKANLEGADMREGKIMKRGQHGVLEDRKRSAGVGAKTILTGAKLTETNMTGVQAQSADFTDADLSSVVMKDANMSGVNFTGANLADSDLSHVDLSYARMKDTIIAGAFLNTAEKMGLEMDDVVTERDMGDKLENLGKTLSELLDEHTIWVSTAGRKGRQLDLSGYDLRTVINLKSYPLTAIRAVGANFLSQNLRGASLQSAVFDKADFRDCILDHADMRGSTFKYAEMARVSLRGAMLCPLQFERADGSKRLQRVDLSGANMRYADFTGADLRDCIMMGIDLSNANLRDADLRRTDLTGALLKGANFAGARLEDSIVDLSAL